MPVYVDVIARLDERAAATAANRVEKQFAQAGKNAGNAMEQALNAELSRSNTAVNQMGSKLSQGFTSHGRLAGRGFGTAFGSELAQSLPGVSGFSSAMRGYDSAAGKVGAVAGRALGLAFTTAAAGIIGAAGYTLFKGFERYKTIDAAKNRLENLNRTLAQTGRATLDVGRVMDTVNGVVEDTRFSLSDAFSVSTRALSSPTGDLKRFMTVVADAAQFTGQSLEDVGTAFINIANSGSVGMEEMNNQLRGIPLEWLAEQVGVTGAELQKMFRENKVGLEDLMQAVERNANGFAKGGVATIEGSIEQLQTAVARLGANFLGALFGQPTDDANGLAESINAISDRLNDVNKWVTAHQDDIKQAFDTAVEVVGNLLKVLGNVGDWFVENKSVAAALGTVIGTAFAASKLSGFISGLQTINTLLGGSAASGAAGAAGSGIMGKVAALSAANVAIPTLAGNQIANQIEGEDRPWWWAIQRGFTAPGRIWDKAFGSDEAPSPGGSTAGLQTLPGFNFGPRAQMPAIPGRGLHWEDGKGWVPDTPGGGPGPAGSPIQPPPGLAGDAGGSGLPKAPQIPLPPEFGQPPQPGESVEAWRHRMDLIEARHSVAEKEARLHQLEQDGNATENDIINAKNDLIQSRMRTQELERKQISDQAKVQVPLPAEYGMPPMPGESVEAWQHRMDVIAAEHDVAQKQAELNALEQSGTATQDELIQARHEFIQAQAKLNDVYTKNMEQTTAELGQIGAEIDKDFGISKGLAGIAENLTKFLANLAMAPVLGALTGVREGLGGTRGGGGIIGMAGALGAFGPQFMAPTGSTSTGYASYAASAMGPPQLQATSGNPNVNAMLALAQSASGKTAYAPASDLINGLADCSGSISDLYEVLKTGTTTPGRKFTTVNFASDEEAAKLGFLPGFMPGALNVGVNPYPGMSGHMAATLPNGVNFEGGGGTGGGAQYGGNAAGALDPQFEKQYYLPLGGTSTGYPTSGASYPGVGMPTAGGYPQQGGGLPGLYAPTGVGSSLGQGIPSAPGIGGAAGGAATGPTIIGGVGWPNGSAGGGNAGSGGGLLGGAASMAAGAGGMALDAMAPGAGTAASIAANIAIQEINRAIQFGGELAGIGVQGLMETFLPVGASEMAANSWITRIAGGIAGMAPQLPNIAGGKGAKGLTEQQQAAALQNAPGPLTPEQVAGQHGQGASPGPGNQTTNNITVNNQRATEDGTGRDIAWHQTNMHAGTMS